LPLQSQKWRPFYGGVTAQRGWRHFAWYIYLFRPVIRKHDKPPTDVTLTRGVLMMVLRWEGFSFFRNNFAAATQAAINPRERCRSPGGMFAVENRLVALAEVGAVFVDGQFGLLFLRAGLTECESRFMLRVHIATVPQPA
jgi:hypothetical protein